MSRESEPYPDPNARMRPGLECLTMPVRGVRGTATGPGSGVRAVQFHKTRDFGFRRCARVHPSRPCRASCLVGAVTVWRIGRGTRPMRHTAGTCVLLASEPTALEHGCRSEGCRRQRGPASAAPTHLGRRRGPKTPADQTPEHFPVDRKPGHGEEAWLITPGSGPRALTRLFRTGLPAVSGRHGLRLGRCELPPRASWTTADTAPRTAADAPAPSGAGTSVVSGAARASTSSSRSIT